MQLPRTLRVDACLIFQASPGDTTMLAREHLTHPHRAWPWPWPWRADESPLNDLDDAESDTELDGPDELPEEVLEQLEKVAPPPEPVPDPGPL